MRSYFVAAACLALFVGLAHSILGELLLIGRLVSDGLPPLLGNREFARRTLRFTWHLPTALACGFAAILLRLARPDAPGAQLAFVERATALSFLASATIVLLISRGKHPGWVGLLGVAILIWMGRP